MRAADAELRAARQYHRRHALAHELLGTAVRVLREIADEAVRQSQRDHRHAGTHRAKLGEQVSIRRRGRAPAPGPHAADRERSAIRHRRPETQGRGDVTRFGAEPGGEAEVRVAELVSRPQPEGRRTFPHGVDRQRCAGGPQHFER